MSAQPQTAPDEELDDVAEVGRTICKNVVFCHVAVHRWRGQRAIADADVTTDGVAVDKSLVTDPRWKLLDATWQKLFGKVENKIRKVVADNSPDFPIPGVYVIPKLRAREILGEVDRLNREEFEPLVEQFVSGWDDYVVELKANATPAQREQIAKALPSSKHALRSRFYVTKHIIPLMDAYGTTELTNADADQFAEEIAAGTRAFVNSCSQSIVNSLTDELKAAVNNLEMRIREGGIVRNGTLDAVQRAFEKLRSFSFVASPEVLQRMETLSARIQETSVSELNEDNRHGQRDIAESLLTAIRSYQQEVDREAGVGSFGRARRTIEV